jgi:hypothetical protein
MKSSAALMFVMLALTLESSKIDAGSEVVPVWYGSDLLAAYKCV